MGIWRWECSGIKGPSREMTLIVELTEKVDKLTARIEALEGKHKNELDPNRCDYCGRNLVHTPLGRMCPDMYCKGARMKKK